MRAAACAMMVHDSAAARVQVQAALLLGAGRLGKASRVSCRVLSCVGIVSAIASTGLYCRGSEFRSSRRLALWGPVCAVPLSYTYAIR